MPVAKHRACSFPDAMKPEQKAVKPEKEGHYSLDNFIKQAIGKEPFLSFSRAGESPVQWIQLLHALDQQGTNKLSKGPKVDNKFEGKEHPLEPCNGISSFAPEMNRIKDSVPSVKGSGVPENGTKIIPEHMQTLKIPEAVVAFAQAAAKANGEPEKYLPGWPLLSPSKVQMQKCDKCSREFCSPINYRRHIRVHRRSLNIDKDFPKNREFLGVFWDKLSLDEAREIVSFKNVALEEVAGSSIIKALTSFIRKPGFSSLPQTYIKAGAALLDVVLARSSGFPISSHGLFSILDDASEKTFLCAGTALSMQKFVFDGEAGKIGLEIKNLVACTSFLVEQKLVKAWLADKDVEALRCHKLLVEEEEAAQKRQAELLERKRLKKLRQKEQKAKEQVDDDTIDLKESLLPLLDPVEAMSFPAETPALMIASESNQETPNTSLNPIQLFLEPAQSLDADVEAGSGDADVGISNGNISHQGHRGSSRHQLIAARRQVSKLPRNALSGLQRAAYLANGHKVWTRKTKPEIDGEDSNSRAEKESRDQPDHNSHQEVLIGSICVTLVDCNGRDDSLSASLDRCAKEKPAKSDTGQNGSNRPPVKLWRPVGRLEVGVFATVESAKREAEGNGVSGEVANRILDGERYLDLIVADDNISGSSMGSPTVSADLMGPRLFSRRAAEAFLAQRWKEAIAADHVKLVLSPETEPSGCIEILEDAQEAAPSKYSILGSAENQLAVIGKLELSTMAASKPMFRAKPEKGSRLKYIPKHTKNA